MQDNLMMSLILNIVNRIIYLRNDFVGMKIDLSSLFETIIGLTIAFLLISTSFLIGKKIRILLFKNKKLLGKDYLIDIGIGYIVIATGVGLLGYFSLFSRTYIIIYSLIVLFLAFFHPQKNLLTLFREFRIFLTKIFSEVRMNKFVFIWIWVFIFLGLVNLVNPEIREDQFHVDLPVQYLRSQTIMLPSKEALQVSASPLLSEMYYSIGIVLGSKESARSIHFIFYILILLELIYFSKRKGYKFAAYAALIFVSSPMVIHETSSAYTDFQWIFCFLLSILILTKQAPLTKIDLILSGFFWGGMLATKLWTIAFLPIPILYLCFISRNKIKAIIANVWYFSCFSFLAPSIWFLRAYVLMGNPFFPGFQHSSILYSLNTTKASFDQVGFNYNLFKTSYFNVFSPLFFIGILFLIYKFRKNINILLKLRLTIFFTIFLLLLIFIIPYYLGRYLFGIYALSTIIVSLGISNLIKYKYIKAFLNAILGIVLLYYLINSLLVLPYTFGFADENKYLSRVLVKDYSSYYDFDRKFNKYINKNDLVATYNGIGYYYANFSYIDANYVFDKKGELFSKLKKNGITKIFLKGGDINWFCNSLGIKGCSSTRYSLISEYLPLAHYYLYAVK